MRSTRLPIMLLAAAALLALPLAGSAAPAPPAALGFVGADLCITCHTAEAERLASTPHGKGKFASLSVHGCETCHGPGSAHVNNPDDPALQPRLEKLNVREQSAVCQKCHSGGAQFFWRGGVHETRGLSCMTCHSVHAFKSERSQLKAASTTDACISCHKDVRADLWKTSHHPIREGKIGCADCHNPHGTQTRGLIKAASVNEQCYTCHTEKRGPFLWEHAPVRESCLNCHTPHGSNHQKLQKTATPYLCQQCHSNTRHPGTLYDATTLANQSRASNRIFNRACLDCHAAIHGSNNPSSPYLAH
ncbi:MAG TPA: DmsE family decaheme c-type cytochrome [Thermoanaerobaculia bacterium]|nr:DmsE family decaheme c-type cytochrome [Thermoanaerobaculia bacterium]